MNISELMTMASSGVTAESGMASMLSLILPLGLMVLFFYFFLIRPEKKRNKEMQNMLNNIQVADEVITNGGIIGRVLSVKEDTILMETGSDRTKIRVLKSCIAKNNTVHEAPAEVAAEPKAKKKKKKKGDKPTEIK